MARCHFIKCPQDTHASRIEIAFEPSSAPGMPAAFFGGTVLAGQEPRGERIIVDYTEFLLPADRLELGFELPGVRKSGERLQALIARQAEPLAGRERGGPPRRWHLRGAHRADPGRGDVLGGGRPPVLSRR